MRALLICASVILAIFVAADGAVAEGPGAVTSSATNVTYSSALLHGTVKDHREAASYYFEYGPTRAYGLRTPLTATPAAAGALQVAQTVGGLQPVATYHYRLVVISAGGSDTGNDRTFVTPKVPLSVAIAGTPDPIVGGEPFTIQGTLSGTEAANHDVTLQANPFPYTAGFTNLGNPQLTNTLGGYSFPILGVETTTQFRVVTVGPNPIVSPVFTESVAYPVTLRVARAKRGFVRLFGTARHAPAGSLVGFQRLSPGHASVNVGGARLGKSSSFSRVLRVRRGVYEALVEPRDGSHIASYSAPVTIR